ncbi:hypothetical protein MM5_203 [Morganella phage vB_Mm5]
MKEIYNNCVKSSLIHQIKAYIDFCGGLWYSKIPIFYTSVDLGRRSNKSEFAIEYAESISANNSVYIITPSVERADYIKKRFGKESKGFKCLCIHDFYEPSVIGFHHTKPLTFIFDDCGDIHTEANALRTSFVERIRGDNNYIHMIALGDSYIG